MYFKMLNLEGKVQKLLSIAWRNIFSDPILSEKISLIVSDHYLQALIDDDLVKLRKLRDYDEEARVIRNIFYKVRLATKGEEILY